MGRKSDLGHFVRSVNIARLSDWSPQVEEYTLRINEMNELFREKSRDFDTIQEGMKQIEEFQKTKAQMEQELSEVREEAQIRVCGCIVRTLADRSLLIL